MKRALSCVLFTLVTITAIAQTKKPFTLGIVDKVESKLLSQTRLLNIYLPDGYDTSKKTYPVIYLLDGSANEDFIHIVGLVQFLTMIDTIPQCIVVGIANTDRRHDFTHPSNVAEDLKLIPTAGGSERFISFLEQELQPYIKKNYRTAGKKTIIGQSLGGLLSTEILLKKPSLFDDYIIVSPSLWWGNGALLSEAKNYLNKPITKKIRVYLSVGTEGSEMEDASRKLAEHIKQSGKIGLFYQPLREETHLTILHNSVYKALEMLQ